MRTLDGLPDFPFEVEARDGAARAGLLHTPRGVVKTPCFMPVGTKGTVKAIAPDRLRALGAQIILGNTYHLALRPGSATVQALGGIHRFMQWDGPILTDSGGYQVFSLRSTARIDDAAVEFRSIYDGSKHVFTPERAMAEQAALGADFIMCLDQCPPGTATEAEVAEAVGRTSRWAERCKRAHQEREGCGTDGPQMLLGITQGGVIPRLRRESAERLQEIGFPAYAIGGLTVGEDRNAMLETTEYTASLLPQDRLRYFMGIGDPEGLLEVIAAGCRRLRLRAAHTHGAHGHGVHARRAVESAQRRARPVDRPAGGRLPLHRLPGIHPRGHTAFRHAEGDTRAHAPHRAQPQLPHPPGSGGAGGHNGR